MALAAEVTAPRPPQPAVGPRVPGRRVLLQL